MNADNTTASQPSKDFVISRVFDAPRNLVWKVWTEPEHVARWMNPSGGGMSFTKMDFRAGGMSHYCMITPDGGEMWGLCKYLEIEPPKKVVQIQSFADAEGNITSHPFAPTWPKHMLSTATFTEKDGKTTITIVWTPHHSTEEEIQTFNAAHAGMEQGWGGSLAQLETYLKEVQSR